MEKMEKIEVEIIKEMEEDDVLTINDDQQEDSFFCCIATGGGWQWQYNVCKLKELSQQFIFWV